jgi:DNA-binding NtrC family response regulator
VSGDVLLIEDDEVLGAALMQRLRLEGFAARWARNLAEGEAMLRRRAAPLCVLCDMRLPDGSGEALLLRLMPSLGATPVIAMTAFGGVEQAVRLIRAGADDYLLKPFDIAVVLHKLTALRPLPAPPGGEMQGGWSSAPMRVLASQLERLSAAAVPVLLVGESGAGKEVAARRLHAIGPRQAEPFVALNCAAIPRDLLESEVFGHERGAFTGASERRIGAAERAGAGTLMFDEIAELDLALQAKLLRLLEDRRFLRLGGAKELPLAARIVAATNADLGARVAEGRFRGDLYWRLAVVELRVPPLRERSEDVQRLAIECLSEVAAQSGRPGIAFSAGAEAALMAHPWPGNVRELRNRVTRAVLLSAAPMVTAEDLFPDQPGIASAPSAETLAEVRDAAEREHIRRVLLRCGSRTGEAARMLAVSRTTLWERMRRLGLNTTEDE